MLKTLGAHIKEYKKASIATPMFMIGWKDNDIGYAGKKLLKKSIEMDGFEYTAPLRSVSVFTL